jgi:hypothetical protein
MEALRRLSEELLWKAISECTVLPFTSAMRAMPDDFQKPTMKQIGKGILWGGYERDYSVLCHELAYHLDLMAGEAFLQGKAFGGNLKRLNMDRITHNKPYLRNYYGGLAAPQQIEYLMKLQSWKFWHEYLNCGDSLFRNEIGRTGENIRWIEVSLSGWTCPVVFGKDPVQRIELYTPHLRITEGNLAWWTSLAFQSNKEQIVCLRNRRLNRNMRQEAINKYQAVVRNGIAALGEQP